MEEDTTKYRFRFMLGGEGLVYKGIASVLMNLDGGIISSIVPPAVEPFTVCYRQSNSSTVRIMGRVIHYPPTTNGPFPSLQSAAGDNRRAKVICVQTFQPCRAAAVAHWVESVERQVLSLDWWTNKITRGTPRRDILAVVGYPK